MNDIECVINHCKCSNFDFDSINLFEKIGFSLIALRNSINYNESLQWHIDRLLTCIQCNQFLLLKDNFGQLAGLALWANVSKAVEEKIFQHGINFIQPNEINGGAETWMLDMHVFNGGLQKVLHALRDIYLIDSSQVTYFRMKKEKIIVKRIERRSDITFFKKKNEISDFFSNFIETIEGESLRNSTDAAHKTAKILGEVAMLARHIPEICNMPLHLILERLQRANKLKQYRLYYEKDKQLCGYISWAWLDREFCNKNTTAQHELALHQWNEGTRLMICDAFATRTGFSQMCKDLDSELFPGEVMHFNSRPPNDEFIELMPIQNEFIKDLQHISLDNKNPTINILSFLRASFKNSKKVHK